MHFFKLGVGVAVGSALLVGAGPAAAGEGQAGWTVVAAPPIGQNANLAGVASSSDSDAWAVGSENGAANTGLGAKALIDHWNGTAWTQVAAPVTAGNTASLAAVSTSGPADAWAVGSTRTSRYTFSPLALHWNGTAWTDVFIGGLSGTAGIGVVDLSPTDAYAIGDLGSAHTGQLAKWNGSTWTNIPLPQPTSTGFGTTLSTISADAPDDVWVTGTYLDQIGANAYQDETYSVHWNGSSWKVVPMPLVGSTNVNAAFHIYSLKANSPTDVWAVGSSAVTDVVGSGRTLTEHWNGTAWSIVPSPSPGTDPVLSGVTTSNAANRVWAVGYDTVPGANRQEALTMNWNGTSWVTVPSPSVSGVSTLLASVATTPGATIVQAVGFSGSPASASDNPFALQH